MEEIAKTFFIQFGAFGSALLLVGSVAWTLYCKIIIPQQDKRNNVYGVYIEALKENNIGWREAHKDLVKEVAAPLNKVCSVLETQEKLQELRIQQIVSGLNQLEIEIRERLSKGG